MRTVLFSANRGYALTSSREALIRRFIDAEWQVVLATSEDDESKYLTQFGAHLDPIVFNRRGVSPGQDLAAYQRLTAIYRHWKPTVAHHFHAKPVILCTLAARSALGEHIKIVNTITGLGHGFTAGGPVSWLAALGYRIALPRAEATVFQNRDDRTLFTQRHWVSEDRARLILGSGVDLDRYSYIDRVGRKSHAPVIVMIGRLLRQKGITEFVEVSHRIRARFPQAQFLLAGEEEPEHPDAVPADWVRNQSGVEYLGRLPDIRPLLEQADILLFTSYYREGVPRVVMESAATGLPTVGFDVPGVRDAVHDGETGYLEPARDVDALTKRVAELLQDSRKRLELGKAARQLAEAAFDIRMIQEQYLSLYRELGAVI